MAGSPRNQEEIRLVINKREHRSEMMVKLNEMRMERIGCDLIINIEGEEIAAHRNIMMAGSDFFDAMLKHSMQENQTGVVNIKAISFRIFEKMVEYIYTGEISVALKDCEEIFFAAGLLQLTSISENMSPLLQSHLTPSSFFSTKKIADKYSLEDLKEVLKEFAVVHLDRIVQNEEFNTLDKDEILFFISAEKSKGWDENFKMAVILQWIKTDLENRKQHLVDLTKVLDFDKISPGVAKYLTTNEQVCQSSSSFMNMLQPLSSVNDPHVEPIPPSISQPEEEKSFVVFGRFGNVRVFNPISKDWSVLPNQDSSYTCRSEFCAALVDDYLYVIMELGECQRLDTKMKNAEWQKVPSMKKERNTLFAAVYEGDIFVVGEHSMEKYSTKDRRWSDIDTTGINCCQCPIVAYYNSLYLFGGLTNDRTMTAEVNRYSPLTSSWSSMTPMPGPRAIPAAGVHDDKIYIGGGDAGSGKESNFWCFDPSLNTWAVLSPLLRGLYHFALCSVGNKIYAVSKKENWQGCRVEAYEPETDKWEQVYEGYDEHLEMPVVHATQIIRGPIIEHGS